MAPMAESTSEWHYFLYNCYENWHLMNFFKTLYAKFDLSCLHDTCEITDYPAQTVRLCRLFGHSARYVNKSHGRTSHTYICCQKCYQMSPVRKWITGKTLFNLICKMSYLLHNRNLEILARFGCEIEYRAMSEKQLKSYDMKSIFRAFFGVYSRLVIFQ